jgi:hypothetical protein
VHDHPFVVAELPVAHARHDPAGRSDECMAGRDQVQELHRPVDVLHRRRDRAGVLEVLGGLPTPLDLGVVDLVAGGVVRHRPERGVRAPQQTGGHRRGGRAGSAGSCCKARRWMYKSPSVRWEDRPPTPTSWEQVGDVLLSALRDWQRDSPTTACIGLARNLLRFTPRLLADQNDHGNVAATLERLRDEHPALARAAG